ncbi:MAG: hypothetical protein JSU07_07620 [Bacteroidetes bacterium]|nr:hypothetical protein [Bacteroidota bacterium]
MLNRNDNNRSDRFKLSNEEIKEFKRIKYLHQKYKLLKFKSTPLYKFGNLICVLSFLIYFELFFCYLFPLSFTEHKISSVDAGYKLVLKNNTRLINELKIVDSDSKYYEFRTCKLLNKPNVGDIFLVSHDVLLRKKLNAVFNEESGAVLIWESGSILFLSAFVGVLTLVLYIYNLNQEAITLKAMSVINLITIIALIFI